MTRRLLILNAGSVTGNNLIRSLQSGEPSLHMVGCATDRFTLKRSIADRNYLVPEPEAAWANSLRALIERERIDLVIPNNDDDVAAIGRLRETLNCRVFLPRTEVIERCWDKFALATFFASRGISVPATYAVESVEQLEELFNGFPAGSRLWCRIRKGSGSIGAMPVTNARQARWWIEYWEEMRDVAPGMFTLAEYLPGRDITVQCVFRSGTLYIAKMLERLAYNVIGGGPSGISSTASLGKMFHEPHIVDLCLRAVAALDPRADGAFSLDLRENAGGEPCITEINAGRFANGPIVHDMAGEPSTILTYVRLALEENVDVVAGAPYADDCYIQRHLDMPPAVLKASELSVGIENPS